MDAQQRAENINIINNGLENLAPFLPDKAILKEGQKLLNILQDRLAHPYAPCLIALCGPTGAGKSHLLNYLAGGAVSPSGYRRPLTASPVLVAPAATLAKIVKADFLPTYHFEKRAEISFSNETAAAQQLLVTTPLTPPWAWPEGLAIIDTPDFDSVRIENQHQALDMARRADGLILVAHQAKYADQSTWDFLSAEIKEKRPLLIVLNRVTAQAAYDDFLERLKEVGLTTPVIAWPEETAVGLSSLILPRSELKEWLCDIGAQQATLVTQRAAENVSQLDALLCENLAPSLTRRGKALNEARLAVDEIIRQWALSSQERLSLNLSGETRDTLLKNLSELVQRSDLWAAPRRLLGLPLLALKEGLSKVFGGSQEPKKLTENLTEAAQEALVAAVRKEAMSLSAALSSTLEAPFTLPNLDFTPAEIRQKYQTMDRHLDAWLKIETERLLAGLPLGQKAAFYCVQFMHVGLVTGFWLQSGGLPGAEVLAGGALGPLISKLTGVVISKENLASFEKRAKEEHQKNLAAIFEAQGERYRQFIATELAQIKVGDEFWSAWDKLKEEGRRLWPTTTP